jgi:hypothetical protein
VIDWNTIDPYKQRAVMTEAGPVVQELTAEVLALRTNDDDRDRIEKAIALAKAGQIIDHPVDVAQQDAAKVMALRRSYGYTWVPSALMPNIEIAPGLEGNFGHLSRYDPAAAPVGAILVPPF